MRLRRLTALTLGIVLVAAGCANASPTPSAAPSSSPPTASPTSSALPSSVPSATAQAFQPPVLSGKKIRFIVDGDVTLSKIVVVHAYNLMKQWGADVSIVYAGSGDVALAGVITGQSDVAESAIDFINAVNSGAKLKAFGLAQPRTDYAFISRPAIKTLADLKGARIGVSDLTGLGLLQVNYVLQAAGLVLSDVTVSAVGGQSTRGAALAAGRVDASALGFSNYLELKSSGYNLLYNYTTQQTGLWDDVLFATPDWLSKNPDLAVAVNEALLESYRWFDDPANKPAFIQEATTLMKGMDASIASQGYDTFTQNAMYPPNAILTDDGLNFNITAFVNTKGIPAALPLPQISDTSFAAQALQAAGQQ